MEIGDKITGLSCPKDEGYCKDTTSQYVGKIGTIGYIGENMCRIDFGDDYCFYPTKHVQEHLVKPDYQQYVGRKMVGFEFNSVSNNGCEYNPLMDGYRLKVGEIIDVFPNPETLDSLFSVRFNDGQSWSYPCDLAISYILNGETEDMVNQETEDMVNHHAHYGSGAYEVIEVIEAWGFDKDFNLGNAIKYIARYDKKGNKIQDLKEAIYYINRKICLLEKDT